MKRFTDTDIWEQDWFIELPTKYKLFWNYIKDKCDNVGVWRPNKSVLQKIVGEPLSFDDFLSFINSDKVRIKVLPNGRWWVLSFFTFQYGDKFSPTSAIHRGALKSLLANGIHPNEILIDSIGYLQFLDIQEIKEKAYGKDIEALFEAYQKPTHRHKEKDKDIIVLEYVNSYSFKGNKKLKKNEITNFESQGHDLLAKRLQGG